MVEWRFLSAGAPCLGKCRRKDVSGRGGMPPNPPRVTQPDVHVSDIRMSQACCLNLYVMPAVLVRSSLLLILLGTSLPGNRHVSEVHRLLSEGGGFRCNEDAWRTDARCSGMPSTNRQPQVVLRRDADVYLRCLVSCFLLWPAVHEAVACCPEG
jgi:hypothetical protein